MQVPLLVFTYNAMPHHITGYQPYELMSGCKASPICDVCLKLAHYNDQASTNRCAWLNEQHELLMSVNRQALKHIRQSTTKSKARASDKTLYIPIGNLVLIQDHPEGWNKIWDNYKSKLFVVVDHHKDPNAYVIQFINKKSPKRTVNRWQLFNLQKSQVDPVTSDPIIMGPKFDTELKKLYKIPQVCHPYGTRSKTKADQISVQSTNIQDEWRGHSGLGLWVRIFWLCQRCHSLTIK